MEWYTVERNEGQQRIGHNNEGAAGRRARAADEEIMVKPIVKDIFFLGQKQPKEVEVCPESSAWSRMSAGTTVLSRRECGIVRMPETDMSRKKDIQLR